MTGETGQHRTGVLLEFRTLSTWPRNVSIQTKTSISLLI
jgi:hypothetical protein